MEMHPQGCSPLFVLFWEQILCFDRFTSESFMTTFFMTGHFFMTGFLCWKEEQQNQQEKEKDDTPTVMMAFLFFSIFCYVHPTNK